MKRALLLCFICCAVFSHALTGRWRQFPARGAQPPQVNKPTLLNVSPTKLVLFDGVKDDCNTGVTTPNPSSNIYLYDTILNHGKYITATGTGPSNRLFDSYWHAGTRSVMVGGGVFYNVDFSIIDFKPFDPLYKLTVGPGYNSASWQEIHPLGSIPSARTEMSVLQNPENEDEVFLYGGVNLNGGFVSYGEVFKYTISSNTFEILHPGSTIDDGSDGLPKSRYHAHIWWVSDTNEFEVHQGVHAKGGSAPITEELFDAWRFNVITKQWRQIFPNPPITVTRRHGVQFQLEFAGEQYFCTTLGDENHVGELPTRGCAFPTVTINTTICSNPRDNNGNGAWIEIDTSGPIMNAKYPGGVLVGRRVFVIAGQREIPYSSTETQQVFNQGIEVLRISPFGIFGDDDD